jgi:hypothetical protein
MRIATYGLEGLELSAGRRLRTLISPTFCGPFGASRSLVEHAWPPLLAAIVSLLCAAPAGAEDWAVKMFDKTTHNFGVVARGANAEWHFVIENVYEEDAHIKSVSSSCKCSKPRVTKPLLKTWEKGEIIVTLDTRGEFGRKDGTIEVEFDQPFEAKVQLHVHSFIRGDVVVQPGAVQFGSVSQGTEAVRELKVAYAPGRRDWQIRRVESGNPYVEAKAEETGRTETEITYKLSVKLRTGAPPGYIQEPLMLVTNDVDASKARIPVNMEGLVASALTVRPAWLVMGMAEVGKPVTSNLVIQGRAPFRILSIRADDKRFTGQVPAAAKPFHIIPITFLANDSKTTPGKLNTKIHIETDLPGAGPVEVGAAVEVVAGE